MLLVLITELPEAPLPTKRRSFLMHLQPATYQTLLALSYYCGGVIITTSRIHTVALT